MSDNGTTGPSRFRPPRQSGTPRHSAISRRHTAPTAADGTGSIRPEDCSHPVSMILVDTATGTIAAANPAGRRQLSGTGGPQLSRWLAQLATATAPNGPDVTVLHTWHGVDGADAGTTGLRAECTPVNFRSRRCLVVALREDEPTAAGVHPTSGRPTPDPARAAFTLDAIGRVDSWGSTAERLTGFVADVVIGRDTTLLHTGPARLAGEPRLSLAEAYRNGEHRVEGWRVRGDGRVMWAEVVTCVLHDKLNRLVGFATTMHDLTNRRGLAQTSNIKVPAPRGPLTAGSVRPTPSRPGTAGGPRPGRVPGQRRPSGR
jgi:PAS domain S-box-containing protein